MTEQTHQIYKKLMGVTPYLIVDYKIFSNRLHFSVDVADMYGRIQLSWEKKKTR